MANWLAKFARRFNRPTIRIFLLPFYVTIISSGSVGKVVLGFLLVSAAYFQLDHLGDTTGDRLVIFHLLSIGCILMYMAARMWEKQVAILLAKALLFPVVELYSDDCEDTELHYLMVDDEGHYFVVHKMYAVRLYPSGMIHKANGESIPSYMLPFWRFV